MHVRYVSSTAIIKRLTFLPDEIVYTVSILKQFLEDGGRDKFRNSTR
jgi:hypothetical protein